MELNLREILGILPSEEPLFPAECKSCYGCKDEHCEYAIKYIKFLIRNRELGKLTHEQLMGLNRQRFGSGLVHTRHWKNILGDDEDIYREYIKTCELARRNDLRPKISKEIAESIEKLEDELIKNGWKAPYINYDGELCFYTEHKWMRNIKEDDIEELEVKDEQRSGQASEVSTGDKGEDIQTDN